MVIYRFTNTADAMWGYRTPTYEHLGKIAARCDDSFNIVPARLTAILIALAAQIVNRRGREAWHIARRDAGKTVSPNAGWPMAAMAGALDTILTKRDHYELGSGSCVPDAAMIAQARQIVRVAVGMVLIGLSIGAVLHLARR
jgi:adenosylcobinamide-phosphate synthase